MLSPGKSPLFFQICEGIENDIISGKLVEETQVPSSNEFATSYNINPATAAKGVNLLVERGILYKKRGIGMFVAKGSRSKILAVRRTRFREQFLLPMLTEAKKIGIDDTELSAMILDAPQK